MWPYMKKFSEIYTYKYAQWDTKGHQIFYIFHIAKIKLNLLDIKTIDF